MADTAKPKTSELSGNTPRGRPRTPRGRPGVSTRRSTEAWPVGQAYEAVVRAGRRPPGTAGCLGAGRVASWPGCWGAGHAGHARDVVLCTLYNNPVPRHRAEGEDRPHAPDASKSGGSDGVCALAPRVERTSPASLSSGRPRGSPSICKSLVNTDVFTKIGASVMHLLKARGRQTSPTRSCSEWTPPVGSGRQAGLQGPASP